MIDDFYDGPYVGPDYTQPYHPNWYANNGTFCGPSAGKFKEWSQSVATPLQIEKVYTMMFDGIGGDDKPQVKTVKVEMTVPALPKGYEYTGEYRIPRSGDIYIECDGTLESASDCAESNYPIVRRKDWYPKLGATVWIVGFDSNILKYTWCDGVYDKELYEQHRVFHTKFLADQAVAEIEQALHSNFLKNNDDKYK